jgi:nitronate monooxygenase
VIAQGNEAGGHRGLFLTNDIATQVGTFALVPQVVDAVKVPVIAAGGVTDARGIAAAFMLGAAGVQIGTAYLFCPESRISARGIVNRLMREIGPVSELAPEFPLASGALAPLRAKAESQGSGEFSPLWSGQAGPLGREIPARELTAKLVKEAQALLRGTSAR